MVRSLHPLLCQCGNVLCPGHSALQCPTLLGMTQKLAPCPSSQLSAQPRQSWGSCFALGCRSQTFTLQFLFIGLMGSWAAEHFPGNSFSSTDSLLPTPWIC